MSSRISISNSVKYPKVQLKSISQCFTLRPIKYDRGYFNTLGIQPNSSYRYIREYDSYSRLELRSRKVYKLTII